MSLDQKALDIKLLKGLNLVVTNETITIGNVSGNGYVDSSGTVTKAGYTPIGIVGYTIYNSFIFPSSIRLSSRTDGSGTVAYCVRNTSSGAASNLSMYVNILWHIT